MIPPIARLLGSPTGIVLIGNLGMITASKTTLLGMCKKWPVTDPIGRRTVVRRQRRHLSQALDKLAGLLWVMLPNLECKDLTQPLTS